MKRKCRRCCAVSPAMARYCRHCGRPFVSRFNIIYVAAKQLLIRMTSRTMELFAEAMIRRQRFADERAAEQRAARKRSDEAIRLSNEAWAKEQETRSIKEMENLHRAACPHCGFHFGWNAAAKRCRHCGWDDKRQMRVKQEAL